MRTTNRKIQFHNPFSLRGGELTFPAGTYDVKVTEKREDVGPVENWKTLAMEITMSSDSGQGDTWTSVDAAELEAELAADMASEGILPAEV